MNPWANCSAVRQGIPCYNLFKNGECDRACASEECLYDGFDCAAIDVDECNPFYDAYCANHYANGHCDKGCDTIECGWDGLDCAEVPQNLAHGTLVFILNMSPAQFMNISVHFLRDVGRVLHSVVRIKEDTNGNLMVYPWPNSYGSRKRRSVMDLFSSGKEDPLESTLLRIRRSTDISST